MRSRPTLTACGSIALVSLLTGLVGCGGDDGDAVVTGGGDPDGFAFEAARLCSDTINDLDHSVAQAGSDASLAVVFAAVERTPLEPADAEQWGTQMTAYRDLLVDTRERLGSIEPESSADQEAWAVVVAAGDAKIDLLDRRVAVLQDAPGGETLDVDALGVGGGEPDLDELDGALATLGLSGRDCEVVFAHTGNPAEHQTFLDAASSACTTTVSRRRDAGFTTDLTLGAVLEVREGGAVTVTPELRAEVEAVADEWQRTADDFRAVPTDDVVDDQQWQATLAAVDERADVFERRAAALDGGDAQALAELFTAGASYTYPGLGDLAALGLDRRDCRSISA